MNLETYIYEINYPENMYYKESEIIPDHNGLFASKAFNKGEIIFSGKLKIEKNQLISQDFILKLKQKNFDESKELKLSKEMHTIEYGSNSDYRAIYGLDVLVNHSCDPNMIEIRDKTDELIYNLIALQEIKQNEELTQNYNLFLLTYDSPFECCCKSEICCKYVAGFLGLNEKFQKLWVSQAIDSIQKIFYQNKENIIEDNIKN